MAGCPCETLVLPTITASTCEIQFDRIQKMSICQQFAFHSVTSGNSSTVAELKTLSEWVDCLAASNVEKQMITVSVGDFVITPGEAITQEFDGETKATGSYAPTNVAYNILGASSTQLSEMRELTCQGVSYVMFFDKDGNIVHALDGTVPGGFKIPKQTITTSDMGQEEAGGLVIAHGTMQLVDGWSVGTGVTVSEPDDFDPLTDLSN
jgi:hypothetical protein